MTHHSSDCGHCRNFQPQWVALEKMLKETIQLGLVDTFTQPELAKTHKITITPTIKLFMRYDGNS